MKNKILISIIVLLTGCVGIPEDIEAVNNFNLSKYLGQWYEIARLDHSFERGLSNVSATYSMRDDGGVKVINKGYKDEKKEWKTAEGKAYFVDSPETGRLKVSFFGPFYGGYNIFELDTLNYSYVMICGNDKSYLWILARTKTLEKEILDKLISKAKEKGFETDKLIFVKQNRGENEL